MDNALATLSDTDNVVAPDTITVNATDSLGNAAVAKTIAVTVANGPVIGVPTGATVGVNKTGPNHRDKPVGGQRSGFRNPSP